MTEKKIFLLKFLHFAQNERGSLKNLQSKACISPSNSEVFRQLRSWRLAVDGWMDGKCTSQKRISFWDGITIHTSWSKDRVCVEHALVYRKEHRTKEWNSWYQYFTPSCQRLHLPQLWTSQTGLYICNVQLLQQSRVIWYAKWPWNIQ